MEQCQGVEEHLSGPLQQMQGHRLGVDQDAVHLKQLLNIERHVPGHQYSNISGAPQWCTHQSGKKQKTSSVNPGHGLSASCGLPPVRELLVDGPLYFAIIRHVEGKQ